MERATGVRIQEVPRLAFQFRPFAPPQARADAKTTFKELIEQAKMIKPALLSHIDDLGIGISQQRGGTQQTHFHFQRPSGSPKVLLN